MAEMACGRLSLLKKKQETLEIKVNLAAVWITSSFDPNDIWFKYS